MGTAGEHCLGGRRGALGGERWNEPCFNIVSCIRIRTRQRQNSGDPGQWGDSGGCLESGVER